MSVRRNRHRLPRPIRRLRSHPIYADRRAGPIRPRIRGDIQIPAAHTRHLDRPCLRGDGDILPPVPHNIQARSRRPRAAEIAREIDLATRRHHRALVFSVRGYRDRHPIAAAIHRRPRPETEGRIGIDLRVLRNRGLIPTRRPGYGNRNPRAIRLGLRPRAVCAIVVVRVDFAAGNYRRLVLSRGRHRHARPGTRCIRKHGCPQPRLAETGVNVDKTSVVDGGLVSPRRRDGDARPVARNFLGHPRPYTII